MKIFVAGTDTGVGKTVVTGLLAGHLLSKGYAAVTQKWVETGSGGFSKDVEKHLKYMGKKKADFDGHVPSMSPYVLKFAASPHLAAKREGKHIDEAVIKKALASLSKNFDVVVIEGIGGLAVPIDGKRLLIDLIKDLDIPVLLVSENSLGAINHTLLSIEALRSRQINVIGILFNETSKGLAHKLVMKDNPIIVKKFTGLEVLGILPYRAKMESSYRAFVPIGNRIIKRLWKTG